MAATGLRNPTRTREFYDNLMEQKEIKPAAMLNKTVSTAAVDIVSANKTEVTEVISTTPPTTHVISENKTTPAAPPVVKPTKHNASSTERPIMTVFNEMWNGVRGMLGIKKLNCLNGGKVNQNGACECPKYFNGTTCEKKQCHNGGVLQKTTTGPITYECQCPNSLYIDGAHCQNVKCANDAALHFEPNGNWYCDCSANHSLVFYKGTFCEKFSPPLGFAVPLLLVLVFLLCCGLCRIDWCPRKRGDRRQETRSSRNQNAQSRRRPNSRNVERARVAQPNRSNTAQEFLLPNDRVLCTRNPVAFPSHGNPYVIRLDTIPTFNPNMIAGVDPVPVGPSKPMEPPPSYDQAVHAPPMPDPPRYSERVEIPPLLQTSQQPPPPSRDPPLPPV